MAIPPLPGPAADLAIIPESVSVINRLISAYETCKRIDYEMAALEVNYMLEKKRLEIKKDELRNQHRQAMERIAIQRTLYIHWMDNSQKETDNYLESQKKMRQQSDQIINAIINDKSNSEYRNQLFELYKEIASRLDGNARDHITNDKIILEQIQNNAMKQIEANRSKQLEM